MSSLEANTYTAKPTVQVANALSGNLLNKDSGIHNLQPKGIQPLLKPVIEHQVPTKTKGSVSTVFQLKHLHNPAPASINTDISRIEVTRKQASYREPLSSHKKSATIEVKKSEPVTCRLPPQQHQSQPHRIFSIPKQEEYNMGNDPTRMANPNAGAALPSMPPYGQTTGITQPSIVTQSNLPAAVTMMSQAGAPSSSAQAISIIKGPSAVTENRVLTTFDTRPTGAQAGGTQSIPVPAIPASGSPRVVSTSSSKTITGASNAATGFFKGHRTPGAGSHHTAVIQSPSSVRGAHNQSIRPGTPPIRNVSAHRPINATNIAPASVQSPTTVQITIHQPPKNTVSGGTSTERPPHNSHHASIASGNALFASSDMGQMTGQPPVRQKLVISQSPSGGVQQNRTTIALGPDSGRTGKTGYRTIMSSTTGQHDYVRAEPQPIPGTTTRKPDTFTSRPGVAVHSMSDHRLNTAASSTLGPSFYPSSSISATSLAAGQPNYFQSSVIPPLSQHQNPLYKAQQHPYSHQGQPSMSAMNSQSGTTLIPTVANQSLINNVDNSSQDSTGSNAHSGSPRPSILRKRTHESMNAVVVKKVVSANDRLNVGNSSHTTTISHLAQSSTDSRVNPLLTSTAPGEKDNASQSSTDTAMSSESSPLNQRSLKQEGGSIAMKPEPAPPDVTPRKKPRKQLLNTAAELKDQHNSSTEEETETKLPVSLSHSVKADLEECSTSPIKDDFVDREGVRWVKMRQRQTDPLLCFYNCTWKSRSNHFQRKSDIKVKEERRPVVSELSNQKGVLQKASGWKFYHISAQFHEMIESEDTVNSRLSRLQEVLPTSLRQHNSEVAKLYELAQANKQRCSLTKDQLQEAKSSMFSILDQHKPHILEIIQKHHSKRPVKKKERS